MLSDLLVDVSSSMERVNIHEQVIILIYEIIFFCSWLTIINVWLLHIWQIIY